MQPEKLRRDLDKLMLFLLFKARHVDVGEKESLQITHLAQERSKHGQGGEMSSAVHLHLLDTVQVHHIQDLHNILTGIEMNFSFLQHRCMETFLCSTHHMR